jgi:hypothetical protein
MTARLTLIGRELSLLGFTELGAERRGSLNTDQTFSIPVTVEKGLEYRIAGVCDMDCFDLDLFLRDPDGYTVAQDVLEDAVPVIAHVPDTTGEYRVDVTMVACGIEPCAYKLATFARGEALGPGGTTFSGELLFHETYQGELDPDDQEVSGVFRDTYEVDVLPGQRLIVDLRSDEFDTFLRVLDPDGEGEENDDYGEETGHSHLEVLALKEGTYSIQVTSFSPGSSGAYVLQVAVVE